MAVRSTKPWQGTYSTSTRPRPTTSTIPPRSPAWGTGRPISFRPPSNTRARSTRPSPPGRTTLTQPTARPCARLGRPCGCTEGRQRAARRRPCWIPSTRPRMRSMPLILQGRQGILTKRITSKPPTGTRAQNFPCCKPQSPGFCRRSWPSAKAHPALRRRLTFWILTT